MCLTPLQEKFLHASEKAEEIRKAKEVDLERKLRIRFKVASYAFILASVATIISIGLATMLWKKNDSLFQENDSLTRSNEGTGLGMPIAKELVLSLGGEIEIKSIKNKGTSIWFTVKAQDASKIDVEDKS